MSDNPDDAATRKTATQILAELVASSKGAASRYRGDAGRESERAAAARSASKSKPALRK